MRETDKFVFFWQGPFSNWHPAQFTDPLTKVKFANTEQAFMWYKAQFFNDLSTLEQIEAAKTPKEAKDLGRGVKNFNPTYWSCVKFGFMAYVNLLKYQQNADLAEKLLDTESKLLVEASPYDRVWGVGLSEDDPNIEKIEKWQGTNLLGLVLMTTRLEILREKGPNAF